MYSSNGRNPIMLDTCFLREREAEKSKSLSFKCINKLYNEIYIFPIIGCYLVGTLYNDIYFST